MRGEWLSRAVCEDEDAKESFVTVEMDGVGSGRI